MHMNYYYWLSLFGFISLLSLGPKVMTNDPQNISACLKAKSVHPFLCEQKMDRRKALASDITAIGIAGSKAQKIWDFWQDHPEKNLDSLLEIKGVGPKTLDKIKLYFF